MEETYTNEYSSLNTKSRSLERNAFLSWKFDKLNQDDRKKVASQKNSSRTWISNANHQGLDALSKFLDGDTINFGCLADTGFLYALAHKDDRLFETANDIHNLPRFQGSCRVS